MPTANASQATVKTVADPNAAYESLRDQWDKCRAVCNGEQFVKDYDAILDVHTFSNLLIPFSPSMSREQYNFYKAEAELPGITAQFSRMLVGGLLRKMPSLILPDDAPEEAHDWIMNQFGQDGSSLTSVLDMLLWEEIQTSRAWVYIDHPPVDEDADLTPEQKADLRPYPVLWGSDMVINWRMKNDGVGKNVLDRVIVYGHVEEFTDQSEFHAELVNTVWVHEIVDGLYQVRVYKQKSVNVDATVTNGRTDIEPGNKSTFELADTITNIMANGERLTYIPAWPLNGSIEPQMPLLTAIIDKEVALYNKISRRNHLLYGAATYTPVLKTNMTDDEFDKVVNKGLGCWLKIGHEDDIDVLKTPTEALEDMNETIAASIEEMAKLGIRMLSPETDQSGVALTLRNASQTAQLGTLNSKVSATMTQVIIAMLNWRYDKEYKPGDVEFSLSADFNPTPLGADWLRLCTEWYKEGLIPRSVWLEILKHNDMVSPDYDDEKGKKEITEDQDLLMKANQGFGDDYSKVMADQIAAKTAPPPANSAKTLKAPAKKV